MLPPDLEENLRLIALIAAVVATALTLATPLQARLKHQARWYHLTLVQKQRVARADIHRNRGIVRWWLNHRTRLPGSSASAWQRCRYVGIQTPRDICAAAWRLRKALRVEARIEARLAAALASHARVTGHFAGWACIHGGEGNSAGGTYTGPLQMTTPWEGMSYNWYAMPIAAVYAIAERVAAAHGFNYSWMQGQWPNTYPPCAAYFQ